MPATSADNAANRRIEGSDGKALTADSAMRSESEESAAVADWSRLIH